MADLSFDRETREYVLAVVRRIVRCRALAEDVTQESLLLAYAHREAFRGDAHPRTWLYRIATNTALGRLRCERRFAARITLDGARHEVPDATEPVDERLCRSRRVLAVRNAVDALPPRYRDVLAMRRDHSEPETARRLGLSLINVKVIAHRARAKVRAAMA